MRRSMGNVVERVFRTVDDKGTYAEVDAEHNEILSLRRPNTLVLTSTCLMVVYVQTRPAWM